jgi:exopolysaccharide biosynthesis polyprenyl glycosylphosphotransferase
LALRGADLAVTAACWLAAYYLRWIVGLGPVADHVPPFWWCVRTLPIVLVVAAITYPQTGLYQLGRRWRVEQELFETFKATGLMMLLLLATAFYIRNPYESRLAHGWFWMLTLVGLVAVRRGFGAYYCWRRRRGLPHGRALIVGTGRIARSLARALRANNWLGIEPLGYVDTREESEPGASTVGTVGDLPELVERFAIDYVFVAVPFHRYTQTQRVFEVLRDVLVEIRLVPDLAVFSSAVLQVSYLDGLPVISLQRSRQGFAQVALKRAMDIALSAIGLVLLSPVLTLIAVIIKLYDLGPILYRQERMGLNGHRFQMLKFRSMEVDAEQKTGPVWARPGDDRRTPFGAFLRRTSLDELPQLLNVLKGDMSLVGPRPERPFFIEKFRRSVPRYMLRHAVKAGITGWAQVNGWRGDTSLRKRVQYDLYYVANWSLWFDIRILIRTVFRVMWDRHAY